MSSRHRSAPVSPHTDPSEVDPRLVRVFRLVLLALGAVLALELAL